MNIVVYMFVPQYVQNGLLELDASIRQYERDNSKQFTKNIIIIFYFFFA